jgi:HEAT repeat protein
MRVIMSNFRIHELIRKLSDVDIKERQNIRKEIRTLAKDLDSPESLITHLDSDNSLIREIVADALGVINHENCVRYLTNLLDKEQDKQVQMAAVYALRDITALSALGALLDIADNNEYSPLVRSLAVQAISVSTDRKVTNRLFDILRKAIITNDNQIVESVFDAFETFDESERSIPNQLLELLRSENTPPHIHHYIISYLGERRYAPAFDDILAFLDSDDTDLQRASATALGKLGISKAIVRLESKLDHADDLVRYTVEQALQRLK